MFAECVVQSQLWVSFFLWVVGVEKQVLEDASSRALHGELQSRTRGEPCRVASRRHKQQSGAEQGGERYEYGSIGEAWHLPSWCCPQRRAASRSSASPFLKPFNCLCSDTHTAEPADIHSSCRIPPAKIKLKAKMCAAHCLSGGKGGSFLWMVELCTTAFFLYFYVPSDLKPHPIRHPLDIWSQYHVYW